MDPTAWLLCACTTTARDGSASPKVQRLRDTVTGCSEMRDRDGWESIGVCHRSSAPRLCVTIMAYLQLRRHVGPSRRTRPTSSVPVTELFRAHAARFAHQLDDAMGHHTLQSAEESDRLTVHRTLSAMIGSAARRYDEWDLVDPEELIIGGTYDGTLLWKRNEPGLHRRGRRTLRPVLRRHLRAALPQARRPAGLPPCLATGDHLLSRPHCDPVGPRSCSTWRRRPLRTSTTLWTTPTTP